ncbi:MAG TPA: hypothetical protein VK797_26760 [Tepidisphaeraceae bacterium]|nr:hypothetical protein [Tepidisphaeraceae bacterium]
MTLYSVLPSFSLGFHGCDQSVAMNAVTRKQALKFSDNKYDWLGSGIYFWENSPERAMEWATLLRIRKRLRRPAVVGAVIDLGNCLNLLDRQYLKVVRAAYENLAEASGKAGTPLPRNEPLRTGGDLLLRNLDCATINTVHKMREESGLAPYDTVRAAFIEGAPLYESSGFSEYNHIQICVRSIRCIKGYFLPLEDVDSI